MTQMTQMRECGEVAERDFGSRYVRAGTTIAGPFEHAYMIIVPARIGLGHLRNLRNLPDKNRKGPCCWRGSLSREGLGTRLRPITYRRPKPLMSLANRPFLEYQVALLKKHGITEIVFATNYMAEKIEAHFGDGSRFGVRMRYALEETPLGTGGAIRNAADLFPGEAVAVFNGDILTDFDLSAVVAFHKDRRAISTITLAEVPGPSPFGLLILNEEGRVVEWREPSEETKKALAADHDMLPSARIHQRRVLRPGAGVHRPNTAGRPSSVERDIYPKLLAERAAVFGFAPGGFWMDVGRAEQLMTATQAVLWGAVHTATPSLAVGEGTRIAPALGSTASAPSAGTVPSATAPASKARF